MSDLNPFDEPLQTLKNKITKLNQRKSTILEEIKWFESNDKVDLQNRLKENHNQLNQLRNEYSKAEEKIAAFLKERGNLKSKTRTILNPRNWFAADQVQFRKTQKELTRSQQAEEEEKRSLSTRINRASQDADEAQKTLDRYESFDLSAHGRSLEQTEDELSSVQPVAKRIAQQKASVDLALKPVVDQLRQYEVMKQQAEVNRSRAAALDRELTYAANSYEKAMVHETCEAEFNVGSPRRVIAAAERDLRRINRDYEKAHKRAMEIGQKAARRIDAIVIDGINLCYDSNQFIGLSALETLIPILQNDFAVTVVFDAAIRRMAKSNDKEISKKLGRRVQVHVVATKGKADETVLDLAENDTHTYILSNDRFGEFNDKRAIREGRVLRHEIVKGRILIHDLGVNAEYRSA